MKLKYQCDNCENKCKMNVEMEEEKIISIEGNRCKKGIKYVENKLKTETKNDKKKKKEIKKENKSEKKKKKNKNKK